MLVRRPFVILFYFHHFVYKLTLSTSSCQACRVKTNELRSINLEFCVSLDVHLT